MDKLILIDKPKDWTSFDVVAKLRSAIRNKQVAGSRQKVKIGHSGTLDPFATGLLIVLVGKMTKKQDEFMKKDKEYIATLKLGFTSTTGDPEGEIKEFSINNFQFSKPSLTRHPERTKDPGLDSSVPQNDKILEALKHFKGSIEQTPHVFSAIKVDGKRAYELAREGKEVTLKPRKVYIYEIELLKYEFPTLEIRVKCSSGTYIRSLAEDIGKNLGCGAYLTELRRTKIDHYDIQDALSIEETINDINKLN